MLKQAAREFCSSTGLHGFVYLVTPKRFLLERIIWIIILTATAMAAAITSSLAWKVVHGSVIETVIDSPHHPIWNFPFPAVTICNFNQISKSKTYKILKHLIGTSEIPIEQLAQDLRHLIQLLATGNSKVVQQWNLIRLQSILDQNNITAERMLQNLTPNCMENMKRCKWKGEDKRCQELFQQIKTPMGFCCSFNYHPTKKSQLSKTLINKSPLKPRKVSGCGPKTGLQVVVDNNPEDYFATDVASYGHRVLVHHFNNFPDWNVNNMLLEMRTLMFVSVSPAITTSEAKIAELPIKDRKCLFTTENKLQNFYYYTHHNCLIECRMNITLTLCGCIPFYYYNENGGFKNNRICNLRDTMCLLKFRGTVISSVPGVLTKFQQEDNKLEQCTCLPSCEYCYYSLEFSSASFSKQYSSEQSLYTGIRIRHHSVLRVFFDDLIARKNTAYLSFYWSALFGLYGGLLSLFTGFSIGTAFELAYFFIIRLAVKGLRRI